MSWDRFAPIEAGRRQLPAHQSHQPQLVLASCYFAGQLLPAVDDPLDVRALRRPLEQSAWLLDEP